MTTDWRAELRDQRDVAAAERRARAELLAGRCGCGHSRNAHTVLDSEGRGVLDACQVMICRCELYRSELDR